MTKLSSQQTGKVSSWVAEGATLSQIQARLASEFDVHMTYMDVRFLVDDLNLSLIEKEEPKKAEEPSSDLVEPAPSAEPVPAESAPQPQGGVSISIDTIMAPGAMVSGSVKFTDGSVGTWYLDQMGQLGFNPPTPGYRPSQADVADFQVKLEAALRQAGY